MVAALAVTNALNTWLNPLTIAPLSTAAVLPMLTLHHFYAGRVEALGEPLPQWFHALTPLILGMICGASRQSSYICWLLAVLILCAALLLWGQPSAAQFIAGFLLVELASMIR